METSVVGLTHEVTLPTMPGKRGLKLNIYNHIALHVEEDIPENSSSIFHINAKTITLESTSILD